MAKLKYLFGPAPSVRLGRSLGINIIPSKICSMDCIYCEAGVTKALTTRRKEYYHSKKIIEEFKENFHLFENITDVITITGAGEPTLHIGLQEILDGIRKYAKNIPIAILTNSTMLNDNDVFNTLLNFDIVVPSLDAISDNAMAKIDRSHQDISPKIIRKSLKDFCEKYNGKLYLETLFCKGINDNEEELKLLSEYIKDLKITLYHIGTITRPPALSSASPVTQEFLYNALDYFKSYGIPCQYCGKFQGKSDGSIDENIIIDRIEALLKLRPCKISDIQGVFGINEEKAKLYINSLIEKNIIVSKTFDNDEYFSHITLNKLKS